MKNYNKLEIKLKFVQVIVVEAMQKSSCLNQVNCTFLNLYYIELEIFQFKSMKKRTIIFCYHEKNLLEFQREIQYLETL